MYLEQTGRLGHIRDHVLSVIGSGVVESGLLNGRVWKQLCKRFMKGGFIVVGEVGVTWVLGLPTSFMVLL